MIAYGFISFCTILYVLCWISLRFKVTHFAPEQKFIRIICIRSVKYVYASLGVTSEMSTEKDSKPELRRLYTRDG